VVGGKVYLTGMDDQNAGALFILDEKTGALDRKIPYGKETQEKQAPGTRSTPTIDGDRAYLISGLGVVYCIDLAKGEKKWDVDLVERFAGEKGTWDFAESLLIDGNRVICTPGGDKALIAALDKTTGETVWTTTGLSDRTSYCSPVIISHGGRRILLTGTAKYIVGADADSGALLWKFEHKAPWGIHGVSPVYDGSSLVYYTSENKAGCVGGGALELAPDGASVKSKWTDSNLDCLHHGVVLIDGYLYGTGSKNAYLMCIKMATGELMWKTNNVGQGVVIYADGLLYVYEGPEAGIMDLVKAVPTGFEGIGRFKITEGTAQHWAHPVIANGRLYVRHGDALIAYDVKAK
jgi:outer membrane protein assembly factor BamB